MVIASFAGFVFLKSAYGNANALTAANRAAAQDEVDSSTFALTNAKTRNSLAEDEADKEDLDPLVAKVDAANEALSELSDSNAADRDETIRSDFFRNKADREHEETINLWVQICLYGGGLFLLLLIWQACVYEGNRWEAYF